MNKNSKITLWIGIGLAVLTLSCQTLTDLATNNAALPTPTPISWPHSAFVPPMEQSQVMVVGQSQVPARERLVLETHHITGMINQLTSLAIYIDGIPIPTEATSGQPTFPPELATIQIVTVDRPEKALLADVEPFLPPTCEDVLEQEGIVLHSPLSRYPSADWNVCYIWTGYVPGTYDVLMVATDSAGKSARISQRIEVIDPNP